MKGFGLLKAEEETLLYTHHTIEYLPFVSIAYEDKIS